MYLKHCWQSGSSPLRLNQSCSLHPYQHISTHGRPSTAKCVYVLERKIGPWRSSKAAGLLQWKQFNMAGQQMHKLQRARQHKNAHAVSVQYITYHAVIRFLFAFRLSRFYRLQPVTNSTNTTLRAADCGTRPPGKRSQMFAFTGGAATGQEVAFTCEFTVSVYGRVTPPPKTY